MGTNNNSQALFANHLFIRFLFFIRPHSSSLFFCVFFFNLFYYCSLFLSLPIYFQVSTHYTQPSHWKRRIGTKVIGKKWMKINSKSKRTAKMCPKNGICLDFWLSIYSFLSISHLHFRWLYHLSGLETVNGWKLHRTKTGYTWLKTKISGEIK